MTHADLVERAETWLRNTRRCATVLTDEHTTGPGESPDAIGWRCLHNGTWENWRANHRHSVLIECKVSLSDFRSDASKPWRVDPAAGMGRERLFMVPAGLLGATPKLPEGCGLLEVHGRRVRVRIDPIVFPAYNVAGEVGLLDAVVRRYQAQGLRYQKLSQLNAAARRARASFYGEGLS